MSMMANLQKKEIRMSFEMRYNKLFDFSSLGVSKKFQPHPEKSKILTFHLRLEI